MNRLRIEPLVLGVVFTAIGGIGGWYAARQSGISVPAAPGDDHPEHGKDEGLVLPPQTLKNLGVTVARIEASAYTFHREIPAVVETTPSNEQPVHAPIGGRIQEIRIEPGVVAAPGQTLLTILRDPIPRPVLTLTEEILKPARESLHEAVVDLKKAKEEIDIVRTELDRVTKYTGQVGGEELPILPRQTAIDLRYQLLRAERSWERARLELQKHGFTDEQVQALEAGAALPDLSEGHWKRVLERNGLWPPAAQRLLDILPEALRRLPWVVATVGELAAGGLVDEPLLAWLKQVPADCDHFLEIGSLLQRGSSVAEIRSLHDMHALDPVVEVKAPAGGAAPDWDVLAIHVKPGARVEAGAPLVSLLDPRDLLLRVEPAGGEQADVVRALETRSVCAARPQVEGSGPPLADLRIASVVARDDGPGTTALIRIRNEPLAAVEAGAERTMRSWRLRAGMRYVLRIPVRTLTPVFVLPAAAVTADGPHRVVFLQDGDHFRPLKVVVAHQDRESAVVPVDAETALAPGDAVVQSGAYALGLALHAGAAGADAHAGHQH